MTDTTNLSSTIESEVQKFHDPVMERHNNGKDAKQYLWSILHRYIRTDQSRQLLFDKLPAEFQGVKGKFEAKIREEQEIRRQNEEQQRQEAQQYEERIAALAKRGLSLFKFRVETTQPVIKRKFCHAYNTTTGEVEVEAATKEEAETRVANGLNQVDFEATDTFAEDNWEWEEDEEGAIDYDDAEITLTEINGEEIVSELE
jgi:hypothetical protein